MVVDGHQVVEDPAEAARLLENDDLVGFDTETTGLSPWHHNIALMQFYGDKTGTLALVRTPNGEIPPAIRALFRPGRTMLCHNGVSFDCVFLHTAGVPWRKAAWYDTLVGETVVTNASRRDVRVNLGASVKRQLGIEMNKDIEHGHWDADQLSEEQMNYAARDVINLPALMRAQQQKAVETGQANALKMEMMLMPIVAQMTINGLPLRKDKLEEMRDVVEEQAAVASEKLKERLGELNLASIPQLRAALQRIGCDVDSTRREVLTDMIYGEGPYADVAQMILDYRAPAQRQKMYRNEWVDQYIINDWVHARFWQCGADTGRFTCSDPNLQQVPRDQRGMFGWMEGMSMVSSDYSQIEVWISASISKDAKFLQALKESADIHQRLASDVYGIPYDDVTKEQRRTAKAIAFTLLFGGSVNGFYTYAKRHGATFTPLEAEQVAYKFFLAYPGVATMRERAKAVARTQYPTIIRLPNSLRRVLVGDMKTPQRVLNTMVQGTAAIGLKYALLLCGERGLDKYIGAVVHDEIVSCVPEAEAVEYSEELRTAMTDGMRKVLPADAPVTLKVGPSWEK
jgi:DNA polymerase I-like protein with 3'-5' exonuclease and polymerase domains